MVLEFFEPTQSLETEPKRLPPGSLCVPKTCTTNSGTSNKSLDTYSLRGLSIPMLAPYGERSKLGVEWYQGAANSRFCAPLAGYSRYEFAVSLHSLGESFAQLDKRFPTR